jgi:hypothetical protein
MDEQRIDHNHDLYRRSEDASRVANEVATNNAMQSVFEVFKYIYDDIPEVFGRRWVSHISWHRERLKEKYGDRLDALVTVALRGYVYAYYRGATYLAELVGKKPFMTTDGKVDMTNPAEYADYEGWESIFYSEIVAPIKKPTQLLKDTQLDTFPSDEDITAIMGVVWFFDAASNYPQDPAKAMDILFEASQAMADSYGLFNWDGGIESGRNEPDFGTGGDMKSHAAIMARQRHAENYALADYVRMYWKENVDPALSAQKAAEEIIRANVVPLSHKKIAEIISALRKREAKRTT